MKQQKTQNVSQKKTKKTPAPKARVAQPSGASLHKAAVDAVAMFLCAPGEQNVQSFRWASEFSQNDTAIAEPFRIVEPEFANSTHGLNPYFDDDQGLSVLFRGVECAAIVYDQNPQILNKTYAPVFRLSDGTIAYGTLNSGNAFIVPVPGETAVELVMPYAKAVTAYAPHGPILYAGAVSGTTQRFLWVDEGDVITVNAGDGVTGDVTWILDRYDATGLNKYALSAFVSYSGSDIVTTIKNAGDPQGYYAIRVNNEGSANLDMKINDIAIGGTGCCMAHLPLPDLEKNLSRETGVRVTALSMMYTNTSPVLELGGNISGYQFGPKDDWLDLLTNDVATLLHSKRGSVTIDIRRGLHGYLKPTQPKDFELLSCTELDDQGNLVDSFYPLDDRGAFLAMAMTTSSAGTGNQGYLTFRYGIEYLTSDTWASISSADVPDEVFKEALGKLRTLDQFHENPLHMKELWAKIKNGAKKVIGFISKNGPSIIKGAEQVGQMIAAL